jgi:hypothetical protein
MFCHSGDAKLGTIFEGRVSILSCIGEGLKMVRSVLAVVALCACASPVAARQWTDASGKYHQEAELVAFDGHLVVLKKAQGRLVAVPLDSLSAADQAYLKSQQAKDDMAGAMSKDRTWTLTDGKKFSGQVMKFGQKDIVISRKYAMLYVNGKQFSELSEFHKYVVPKLVSHEEGKEYKDDDAIQSLIASRKGADLVYPVKGVVFQLQSGEYFAVPIWLLSAKDRKVIEPEWNQWLAAENEKELKQQHQQEQSTMARAAANEYQKNQQIEQRLQYLQLASQWFDLWRVALTAPDGSVTSVVVPARDSRAAQIAAQNQCPNCVVGATAMITKQNY